VLIIGPWNYPFQLLLTPLIGAIAAGNCVVLKPSELAPASAAVIGKIIEEIFPPDYITLVQGEGHVVIPEMMNGFRFGHIFYTGSTQVGKIIYQMAAQHLVPVTLELGGKSPCIIEEDADLKIAARRIAVTKFSNAGQMCVAPDYLLVHESIKDKFVEELKQTVLGFYDVEDSPGYNFGKIVNEKQFDRLKSYLAEGTVVFGGRHDRSSLYIQPTLLANVSMESKLMKDEIFGPLLPMITWKHNGEVYQVIERNKNPLALYVFTSSNKKAQNWMNTIAFGGGCINNASWHLTNHNLPFGGIGDSGFGSYHGKYSFDTFSHKKAIMKTPVWFDPDFKYPPFKGKLKWFKKIIK
jgi:aldehyde dehydrogenase (NAD+)